MVQVLEKIKADGHSKCWALYRNQQKSEFFDSCTVNLLFTSQQWYMQVKICLRWTLAYCTQKVHLRLEDDLGGSCTGLVCEAGWTTWKPLCWPFLCLPRLLFPAVTLLPCEGSLRAGITSRSSLYVHPRIDHREIKRHFLFLEVLMSRAVLCSWIYWALNFQITGLCRNMTYWCSWVGIQMHFFLFFVFAIKWSVATLFFPSLAAFRFDEGMPSPLVYHIVFLCFVWGC